MLLYCIIEPYITSKYIVNLSHNDIVVISLVLFDRYGFKIINKTHFPKIHNLICPFKTIALLNNTIKYIVAIFDLHDSWCKLVCWIRFLFILTINKHMQCFYLLRSIQFVSFNRLIRSISIPWLKYLIRKYVSNIIIFLIIPQI